MATSQQVTEYLRNSVGELRNKVTVAQIVGKADDDRWFMITLVQGHYVVKAAVLIDRTTIEREDIEQLIVGNGQALVDQLKAAMAHKIRNRSEVPYKHD